MDSLVLFQIACRGHRSTLRLYSATIYQLQKLGEDWQDLNLRSLNFFQCSTN